MQSTNHRMTAHIHKSTEKKHTSAAKPPSRHKKSSIPDIDTHIHPDSDVTIRTAMGPTFNSTFARIDALNGKEIHQFMLVIETYLGPQRVHSVNKQFSIGEWNCAEYLTQSNQKLQTNAEKHGIESFSLVSSKAVVSAKNMAVNKYINADVVEPDDWKDVEESVEYLIESKSKGIRVDFKMLSEATVDGQLEEDHDDESDAESIDNNQPKKVYSMI